MKGRPTALPPIRHVVQRHELGCAVACVAMVTGVSYGRALEAAHRPLPVDPKKVSLNLSEAARAVRRLGQRCTIQRGFFRKNLPAILVFEWGEWGAPGDLHAIVWDPRFGGRLVDPGSSRHRQSYTPEFYMDRWRASTPNESLIIGMGH